MYEYARGSKGKADSLGLRECPQPLGLPSASNAEQLSAPKRRKFDPKCQADRSIPLLWAPVWTLETKEAPTSLEEKKKKSVQRLKLERISYGRILRRLGSSLRGYVVDTI
ncbi:hypothetical protein R1flu_019880 [Riccia fluitans]|uniref:Uncharacterized protein n=1 Tax=Riccia fluitans TaxID=41844 RepID=A0ABD1ZJW4_9MARC